MGSLRVLPINRGVTNIFFSFKSIFKSNCFFYPISSCFSIFLFVFFQICFQIIFAARTRDPEVAGRQAGTSTRLSDDDDHPDSRTRKLAVRRIGRQRGLK